MSMLTVQLRPGQVRDLVRLLQDQPACGGMADSYARILRRLNEALESYNGTPRAKRPGGEP